MARVQDEPEVRGLHRADERRAERDLDRAVDLARLLAERLIGRAIDLNPEGVVELARKSLLETRGAKKITIDANPNDKTTLISHLDLLGMDKSILVRENLELARGSLILHTDLGTLDARLTPQLERLASALREILRNEASVSKT